MCKVMILALMLFSVENYAFDDLVSKNYYVKGMTCGGCILGVKISLNKSEKLKIHDRKISVGKMELRFIKEDYKKRKTDCEVSNSIEKYTEFYVYLDEKHTQKACDS